MATKTSTVDNDKLEHTAGGVTTRDVMDAGVPMTPGNPAEPIGPEDALGPGPKRGDYSDRINGGPSMRVEVIPYEERLANATRDDDGNLVELGPAQRLVPAHEQTVGDAPGKGGVSTAAALEQQAAEVAAATGDRPDAESGS
jgi:hypothetical protein